MIKETIGDKISEIQCDICGTIYNIEEEIEEFIRFNYITGKGNVLPNKLIKFDVCQDCFQEAFSEIFDEIKKGE